MPELASQTRRILSTPERPPGPSLEERNKDNPSRVQSQPHEQLEDIQTQDDRINQAQRPSDNSNEEPDKRVILSDPFYDKDVPVFEKFGTRPEQAPASNRRDNIQGQARLSKPPNYSRINSTIKLVRTISQSSIQQVSAQPTLSYSAIVKGNSIIKLNTSSKSTLKSTSNIQSQVATEPRSKTTSKSSTDNTEPRIPFKLVPVIPPNKNYAAKPLSTALTSSKSTQKRRAGINFKIKPVISRSLSQVQEDMQIESTTDISNNKRVIVPTTYTISSQQST